MTTEDSIFNGKTIPILTVCESISDLSILTLRDLFNLVFDVDIEVEVYCGREMRNTPKHNRETQNQTRRHNMI